MRKLMIALAATAALGAAALAPTSASAGGGKWGGNWHHGHGWGVGYAFGAAPLYVGGYNSCWVKRWVATPRGARLRTFYICE